jgi:hypothetical protein
MAAPSAGDRIASRRSGRRLIRVRGAALGTLLTASVAGGPLVGAQAAPDDDLPLQCWWRTSVSAIRIGEHFSAVLTCAVTETRQLEVVVDRSRLEPVAAQFPPLEVLGGTHAPEVVTSDRRFFQYEYTLRLISDAFFNRDVQLTSLPITYRVRRMEAGQSAAVEGSAQQYELPPTSIRVISVVPDTARDIRDATPATFAALAAAQVRASMLVRTGVTVSALAAALALVGFVRLAVERRGQNRLAPRQAGKTAVLRAVGRELAAIQRDQAAGGWNGNLVGRALAASRVAAAYAVDRPVSQQPVDAGRDDVGGIEVTTGRLQGGRVSVSAAVTAAALRLAGKDAGESDRRRRQLETLFGALDSFTQAHYGSTPTADQDNTRLEQALSDARGIVRQLRADAGPLGRVKRAIVRTGRAVRLPWAR